MVSFLYMLKRFLFRLATRKQLKNVPEAERERILDLVEKDPALFKKIGEEIDRRVKKGGESKMKASVEVMRKYRSEIQALQGKT